MRDVPEPAVPPGHALVRVRACGVNHLDIHIRRGLDRVPVALPHIPGSDVAGELVRAEGPCELPVGARVVVAPGLSCRRCVVCLRGEDHLCRQFRVIGGYRDDGGYAEYLSAPIENLAPLADTVPYQVAAAMPTTYQTAWQMLVGRARLTVGQRVLVHAAGSGVGSAAVQIAVLLGAEVIATAGDDRKLAVAAERGAAHVINYRSTSVCARVRELFGPQSIDVVAEQVGTPLFWDSVKLLRPGGILVTCGATADHRAEIDLRYLFARNLTVAGSALGPKADFHTLVGLLGTGQIRPLIDAELPIEDVRAAHDRIERGDVNGKIVLTLPGGSR